jgi:hypothetical protein
MLSPRSSSTSVTIVGWSQWGWSCSGWPSWSPPPCGRGGVGRLSARGQRGPAPPLRPAPGRHLPDPRPCPTGRGQRGRARAAPSWMAASSTSRNPSHSHMRLLARRSAGSAGGHLPGHIPNKPVRGATRPEGQDPIPLLGLGYWWSCDGSISEVRAPGRSGPPRPWPSCDMAAMPPEAIRCQEASSLGMLASTTHVAGSCSARCSMALLPMSWRLSRTAPGCSRWVAGLAACRSVWLAGTAWT